MKKSGHACEVKLLPRELSKGDGMGAAMAVPEGLVPVAVGEREVIEVGELDAKEELETEDVAAVLLMSVAVDRSDDAVDVGEGDVELGESTLSCRRWSSAVGTGGGSRWSQRIWPLLSNCLNSAVLSAAASNLKFWAETIERKEIRAMYMDSRRRLLQLTETAAGRQLNCGARTCVQPLGPNPGTADENIS